MRGFCWRQNKHLKNIVEKSMFTNVSDFARLAMSYKNLQKTSFKSLKQ